jgi:hypothetical protein
VQSSFLPTSQDRPHRVVDGCANQQLPVRRVLSRRVQRAHQMFRGCQEDAQLETSKKRAATLLPPRHAMSGGLGLETECTSTSQPTQQQTAYQAAVLATSDLGGTSAVSTNQTIWRIPRHRLDEPLRDPSKRSYPQILHNTCEDIRPAVGARDSHADAYARTA